MPEKEGSEDEKTTKGVVKKKQKQMMGEEGYDHYKDRMAMAGREIRSKDTKDASSYPQSRKKSKGDTPMQKEFKKKYGKKATALDAVKADITAKYGKGAIMNVKKEELDLSKIAEAFDGYIIERAKGNPFASGRRPFSSRSSSKNRRSYDKPYESPIDKFNKNLENLKYNTVKEPGYDSLLDTLQGKDQPKVPTDLPSERAIRDAVKNKKVGRNVESDSGSGLGDLTYKDLQDFSKKIKSDPKKYVKKIPKGVQSFFGDAEGPFRKTWRKIRREPVGVAIAGGIARDTFKDPPLPPIPVVKGGRVGKRTAG